MREECFLNMRHNLYIFQNHFLSLIFISYIFWRGGVFLFFTKQYSSRKNADSFLLEEKKILHATRYFFPVFFLKYHVFLCDKNILSFSQYLRCKQLLISFSHKVSFCIIYVTFHKFIPKEKIYVNNYFF